MTLSEVREIVERLSARQDFLDACARRDLGAIIAILKAHGVTQGQIAELTGIGQGRLSEWTRHKRVPLASATFESFADGLGMPATARQALGLAPGPAGNSGIRRAHPAQGQALPGAEPPSPSPRLMTHRPPKTSVVDLAGLHGLEVVRGQLEEVIAVLEAERSRKNAGSLVKRPAWKNLVFTGGPGSGKSRTAAALGQAYRRLGVLTRGHVIEAAAADLAGTRPHETATLVAEAIKPASGGILVINAAHDLYRLPDHGQQVLRRLYAELTEWRIERKDELAVILAGQADPLGRLLRGHPSLAARFRAVIEFPGYTPEQLTAIFASLAGEAGLRVTSTAGRKAATALEKAEAEHNSGNARLAVRLLNRVTAAQARRLAGAPPRERDQAAQYTITEADIPDYLPPYGTVSDEDSTGQYL